MTTVSGLFSQSGSPFVESISLVHVLVLFPISWLAVCLRPSVLWVCGGRTGGSVLGKKFSQELHFIGCTFSSTSFRVHNFALCTPSMPSYRCVLGLVLDMDKTTGSAISHLRSIRWPQQRSANAGSAPANTCTCIITQLQWH